LGIFWEILAKKPRRRELIALSDVLMGVTESIKEAYYSLEDKWYSFVDKVSEKVPAFGGLIDSLEDKNIPTFPAAIILVLLILVLLFFFLTAGNISTLSLTIKDNQGVPLAGATVTVLQNGTPVANTQTTSTGQVYFNLANGDYTIKAEMDKHSTQTKTITLNGTIADEMVLSLEDATISKAINLKSASGDQLISGSGTLRYRCIGDNTDSLATYSNGKFTAQVKESCAGIELLDIQNYTIVNSTASFSGVGDSFARVTPLEQKYGTVNVNLTVSGTSEVPKAGLTVSLVPLDNTIPILQKTDGTSLLIFQNAPIKKYYISVTSDGNYSTYNGSSLGIVKDVLENQTTTFDVALTKTIAGNITIITKDKVSKLPIAGVQVTLTSATNSNDTQVKLTGALGQAQFSVAGNDSYIVTTDQANYIIGSPKAATAGDMLEILMDKVDSSNANSLLVKVLDSDKNPIDHVRVQLKSIEGAQEPIVGEKTTTGTGEAEFFNLDITKSYLANVSKEGFGSVNSTTIQISPRQQTELDVTFDIGKGTIRVIILDPEKNPLSGVSIKPMDAIKGEQIIESKLTGTDGLVEFSIRADKKAYFIVESTAYAKYTTAASYPTANATEDKEITLAKKSAQLSAAIIGIYSGSDTVSENTTTANTNTLSQGTYKVIAVIQVPKGNYSEAGLHLRTGAQNPDTTNLMEADGLYLSAVNSAGRVTKGTTYTPPSGYTTDQKNLTTGDAKWANSVWKNPAEGTYEVEAEVTVTETNAGNPLQLYYRGWAKGASVLRDPVSTTATANELYSPAKLRMLSAGAGALCSTNFCKSMTIEAMSGSEAGKRRSVSGTIAAKKDIQYLLTINLTNSSNKAITGAQLIVEGKSLTINGVNVNGADQVDKTVALGTIGVDAPILLKVLFTPSSSGTSGVRIAITSATEYALDETVGVSVKPNKKFSFDMVPKVIVPFIGNTLFFEAKDNNESLSDVLITIKSGKDVIGNITTTGEGLAKYELAAPDIGDELTITAQKEGYETIELVKQIDEALLTITPPEISELIKIGEVTGITEQIILSNNTAKNIRISSVQINGDLKQYIDAKFDGTIEGTTIAQATDKNYNLSLKLNNSAMRLLKPTDVKGTITINTDVIGASESFASEIPISVRISLPGYLDEAKCLSVNPTNLEFITSDTEQTKTITLTNSCTAESNEIPLHNLEAKLSTAAKFGSITISGTGIKTTTLTEKYTQITDYYEKNSETDYTIKFTPSASVSSGAQEFIISIVGKNLLDDDTEEKSEAQIKTKTTMSNLSKCIEVVQPSGGILLDTSPWTQGLGTIMGSNYGYGMSAYGSGYQGFSRQMSPYNMQYIPGMGMNGYGTAGYGNGYGGIGYGGAYNGRAYGGGVGSMPGQSAFTIRNNCSSDIEVALDVDPRISVSSQKFTINENSEEVVDIQPGYVLGKYKIKINAKPSNVTEAKTKVDEVSVTVRRLGDIDSDCIKANVSNINLNSFIYRPEKYTVYNYCYDTGVMLSRNNIASIQCTAPNSYLPGAINPGYFQHGMESYYGMTGYPLGGIYNGYNDYLAQSVQQNGCATPSCSLITGTRVRYRTIETSGNKSVERVDFEVMPNTSYMPQRKLFNSRTGSFGLFQSVGDFRDWATQTDARTNVYGSLNISYTSQYGSNQCMEFPITITDMWRLGESIDSAINWGDPNASPRDCVNKEALDLYTKYNGAIPAKEYKTGNGTKYFYLADPPALRIGPSPTQNSTYYPGNNYLYYQDRRQEQRTDANQHGTKNCGMLDNIVMKTRINPQEVGNLVIAIEPVGSGSVLKNNYGSDLAVTIDRSGMTVPCVYINTLITAKVTRAVNMDSQEVTWPFKALILRQDAENSPEFQITSEKQAAQLCLTIGQSTKQSCEDKLRLALQEAGLKASSDPALIRSKLDEFNTANKPVCVMTMEQALTILGQATTASTDCATKAKEAGFNLIKTTDTKSIKGDAWNDFCSSTNFCNSDQLQLFILNKLKQIDDNKGSFTGKLSELYKHAEKTGVLMCSDDSEELDFYKGADISKKLILEAYNLNEKVTITQSDKESITKLGPSALKVMVGVLEKIKTNQADFNSVLLEVDDNISFAGSNGFAQLRMTIVTSTNGAETKRYLSLSRYIQLLTLVDANQYCNIDNKSCSITNFCGSPRVDLDLAMFKWMSANSRLVKGIYAKNNQPIDEQEKIYLKNNDLKILHELATFSTLRNRTNPGVKENILLTQVAEFKAPQKELAEGFNDLIGKFNLKISPSTLSEPGAYSVQIDYDLNSSGEKIVVDVNISDLNKLVAPANVKTNALLINDFKSTTAVQDVYLASKKATIYDAKTQKFYQRIPLLLNVTISPGANILSYKLNASGTQATAPQSLIDWYDFATKPMTGKEKGFGGGTYGLDLSPISTSTKTAKAIYYYPTNGTVIFPQAKVGAIVSAKSILDYSTKSIDKQSVGANASVEVTFDKSDVAKMTLDSVVKKALTGEVCIEDSTNNLVWNESQFINSN
jgi:hypothetical protein